MSDDLHTPSDRTLFALAAAVVAGLIASGWDPYDRTTWWLEVAPVLIVLPLLAATRRRYPLSTLLVVLVAAHCAVLMAGGAWTYARVPWGFSVAEWFGWSRNPYDKLGHFMQGFVPALAAREVLRRGGHVKGPRMLAFLCLCVVMAISAWYELIEWGAAVALGQGADEFLGTQGDPWDTQSDMAMAGLGALVALALLSRWHDRQLGRAAVPFH